MIRIKTAKQIAGIRESCHLLAEVLDILENAVEIGMTTRDLDELAQKEIALRGGRPAFLGYQGFPGALCTSVNEEVIHGIPGERKLNRGDVVSIDCGIEYRGYYSDSAITVPVGEVSREIARLLEVTRRSLQDGIDAAVYGNRGKPIFPGRYTIP